MEETNIIPNQPRKKLNLFVLGTVVILVIAVSSFIFLSARRPVNFSGYPQGTEIEVPKDKSLPDFFPKEAVMEGLAVSHINTVNYPDGKLSATVVGNSDKTLIEAFQIYGENLTKENWNLDTQSLDSELAILTASKGENILTFSFLQAENGTEVTASFYMENK